MRLDREPGIECRFRYLEVVKLEMGQPPADNGFEVTRLQRERPLVADKGRFVLLQQRLNFRWKIEELILAQVGKDVYVDILYRE